MPDALTESAMDSHGSSQWELNTGRLTESSLLTLMTVVGVKCLVACVIL